MAFPVIITDGQTNLTLNGGKLPVDVDFSGITVNATFPATVNVSITGNRVISGNVGVTNNVTVNNVIETVNTAVTNNITVNDVIETVNVSVVSIGDSIVVDSIGSTVNVSLTGSKDVTGNVVVSQGTASNLKAQVSGTVDVGNTPDVTGNVVVSSGNIHLDSVTGNIPVDIKAFSDTLTVNNVVSTVNVSLTGSKDVTGNVVVSQGTASNLKAQVSGTVDVGNTPDVTGNVIITSGNVNIDSNTGNLSVDIKAFNDTLTVNDVLSTVNVAVTGTPNVAVTNTANVAVTSAPTINVTVLNNEEIHPEQDSGVYDAFGRTRVSEPYTLFQSTLVVNDGSWYWDEAETGTANESTSVWEQNLAAVILTVNATQNTQRVRQTFERFSYQPGKSQQVMMSFIMGTPTANVTKEIGYGDEFDGLFLRSINTVAAFTRRTRTSGSTVETTINQIDWNLDTMNGAGASGKTIDWTKTQIMFIDFEWLGVGRARMGFVIDGKIIYAHAFNNTNSLSTVYMRTPVLPLRYKIGGNGSQTGNHTLTCICASVAVEGSEQPIGRPRSASSGTTNIACTANWTILLAIRGVSGGKSVKPREIEVEIVNTDNSATAQYALILAPVTNGGALTYGAISGSQIEAATGNAAQYATGGYILHSGYVAGRSADAAHPASRIALGYSIAGVARELMLCARILDGTPNLFGIINWNEV